MKWSVLLLSAVAASAVQLTTSPGHASASEEQRPVVLLLIEEDSGRLVRQLRDELAAFGFEGRLIQPAREITNPAQIQSLASEHDAAAALRISTSRQGVEVWIVDRMTGKTIMREVVANSAEPSTEQELRLIAIQTVELLRASLLEIQLAQRPPAPVPVPPEVETRVAQETRPYAFAVGVGSLWFFERTSPSLQIEAEGSFDFARHFQLGAVGSMPLVGSGIDGESGSAEVRMTRVGAFWRVLLNDESAQAVPTVGIGAEGLFTHVSAAASPGYSASDDKSWRFLGRIEGGAFFRFGPRAGLRLDASLGIAPQRLVIRFDQEPQAKVGPLLLGSALKLEVGW